MRPVRVTGCGVAAWPTNGVAGGRLTLGIGIGPVAAPAAPGPGPAVDKAVDRAAIPARIGMSRRRRTAGLLPAWGLYLPPVRWLL
jgi:hypothetical protein